MYNPIPEKYQATVKDIGERAVKTFAGGFIVGAHLIDAATGLAVGQGTVAFSDIDWAGGFDVGSGTLVLSILFSLWSLRRGNPGTASLTTAVELAK